jgi:TonB family protein
MIPLLCTQPDRPAALVQAARPEVPPMALQQGIAGVVRVRVALDATGAVRDVAILSSPSGVLKSESLRVARASTFAPARRRCTNVASEYEFRVLYDPDRPAELPVLRPTPAPTPSPSPPPAPNLSRAWKLTWSTGGTSTYTDRTLSSSRAYARIDDSFPLSHRKECHTTLSGAAFERFVAALQASSPDRWLRSYDVGPEPTPAPTAVSAPTIAPAVDVIAAVRAGFSIPPRTMDGGSSSLTLTAGGVAYETAFEYFSTYGDWHPIPSAVQDVMHAFNAADAECARRARGRRAWMF